MGESTSQIEWDIAAERNALGRNLHELGARTRELADWRTYFRNHPFAMMGVALGGGLLLGAFTAGSTPSGMSSLMGESTSYSEPDNEYPAVSRVSSQAARLRRQFGDTWDHVADALLGVASAKAIEFVSQMVPGFQEQYSARHPEHRAFTSERMRNS